MSNEFIWVGNMGTDVKYFPANTRRWTSAGVMLAQRLRRWANITSALVQRLVFAGFHVSGDNHDNTMVGIKNIWKK